MGKNLHMSVGANIGEILLQMANEAIMNGNPNKAIDNYVLSFHGFTKEYALDVIKNKYVLVTDGDGGSVSLSTDAELLKKNESNIIDWFGWVGSKVDEIDETRKAINNLYEELYKLTNTNPNNINIRKIVESANCESAIAAGNIAAKLIAGENFSELNSSGEKVWDMLEESVETDEAEKYEKIFYFLVRYVDNIKRLTDEYVKLATVYEFLLENDMLGQFIDRYPFTEQVFEDCLYKICKFIDPTVGFYHPLCDEKITELKEKIDDKILQTKWGKEYRLYGILIKNPKDSYDAGWISPEGEFYADMGETNTMIHMRLAEKLFKKKLDSSKIDYLAEERWLTDRGWVKVHHNEAYVYLAYRKYQAEKDNMLFVPTEAQIDTLCTYMDSNFGGKFYTEFSGGFGREIRPEEYTTYKIKQMDEFALHKAFSNH